MMKNKLPNKDAAIRSIVRSILSEITTSGPDGFDAAGGNIADLGGRQKSSIAFTADMRLGFGPWDSVRSFKGDTPDSIVLELNVDDGSGKTWDKATKLGAKFIPDFYLEKGRPFYKALTDDVKGDQEALKRNLAIARAKSAGELEKTYPFNASRSFYVVVDSRNTALRDLSAIESKKDFDESLLGLILNNPATAYGKLVKKMPPGPREEFTHALQGWASAMGAISGGAAADILFSGGTAAPISTAVMGIADAAGAPAWLALSSIAAEKGDYWEAVFNLFFAGISGYFAYNSILTSLPKALRESDALRKLAASKSWGGSFTTLEQANDFIVKVASNLKGATFIPKEGRYYLLEKGASDFLKDESGSYISFGKEGRLAVQKMIKDPSATLDAVSKAAKVWDSSKAVVGTLVHAGMLGMGLNYDIETFLEQIEGSSNQDDKLAPSSDAEGEKIRYVRSKVSDIRRDIMTAAGSKDPGDFYKKYTKPGKLVVVNSDNLKEMKVVDKINIPGSALSETKPTQPDMIFVPKSYYDVYEQLVSFPSSFFNPNRNIFVNMGSVVFVFPAADVTH